MLKDITALFQTPIALLLIFSQFGRRRIKKINFVHVVENTCGTKNKQKTRDSDIEKRLHENKENENDDAIHDD